MVESTPATWNLVFFLIVCAPLPSLFFEKITARRPCRQAARHPRKESTSFFKRCACVRATCQKDSTIITRLLEVARCLENKKVRS